MRKQVKGAGVVSRETEKEAAEAEEKSYERGTGEEKEGKRRRIEEADEGEEVATRNNCGERSGRREEESTLEAEKTGHESETRELGRRAEAGGTGQEKEGGLQHDGAVFSSPAYLYEDAYFGGQNDYYAVDSFFDDWVEDDATQIYCGNAVLHKGTDGVANSEGKERDGCSLCGDEETDTAKAQERGDVEKRGEAASVNSMTAPTGRTHEKTTLLEKNSQPPKRRLHKQQQQQEQRKGQQKQAPQQEQEEGHEQGQEHHEVKKAVGEEEHLQPQHCSRQRQQSLRRQHGKNLSGTAEERLKRQQQRLEARKKRHGDREYERREKKKVQQQEQQIRIYFAGAEATVVFALKKLLQQPQFLSLSEIVVVFCEVARQQPEHEIDATEAVFCPTPTKTLDIVHGTRSQISISPALLSEEFATVSALTRLCPAALCIVRMPCPIQNYLQQLQIQTLQTQQLSTQQNLVAQPQPEQLLIQPYVSIQGKTVGKHGSEVTQQQSVHSPFACSSSNDTARSSSCCSTSREDAGIDGSSTEKSNRPLGLYTHFLVLPLFTETTRLRSLEAYSRCVSSTSSSCIVPTGSGTAQSAIKQRQDEHFLAGDTCFVRRLTCTKALVNNQSDGNTARDNASDSHLGAAGGCSSHENYCRKRTTTSSPLSEEVEYRPTFHSLPRQLNNLLRELRGAGRVVCIFQGVRASLAVPQPRVDDDAEVERTERDGAPSPLITLSQRGHTDNRCCSCQCIPASGEVACSCESSGAAYIDFECSSPTQYGSPAAQKDADSRGTETGQGSSRSNTIETLSAGRWRSTSVASEKVVAESTREGARSRNERIQTLDSEVGQDSSCLRENEKFSAEGRPILSPGELDETIATLLVDCGVDCVEPPDATSTADYILTAVKHMRAAQRAVGEQHVRMKKSKTFTAAEAAILAEVAHAATSTIADYAFLYHPHVSTATQGGPPVRCPEAAAASRPASCDVATGAHARSQIAAPVPATAMVPSGVAALAAMATGATPQGASAGHVVALRGSRSTAVGREGTCEDVFTAYKDVFSFACRLWGKQLVQIPTVTEKVAAALMRQYKRPAALLQKIHVAEADKRRAGAHVPDEEAKFVSEANASSRSHWTGRRKGAPMSAANYGHRAPGRLLVQTQLIPLQNAKKVQNVAQDKAGMRRNRIEKKKQMDQAVERVVGELADIVLHGLPADGFHAKSAGTEEDFAEAVEDIRAYKAAGKVAKIGTARARKIYLLFAEDASGIP